MAENQLKRLRHCYPMYIQNSRLLHFYKLHRITHS